MTIAENRIKVQEHDMFDTLKWAADLVKANRTSLTSEEIGKDELIRQQAREIKILKDLNAGLKQKVDGLSGWLDIS